MLKAPFPYFGGKAIVASEVWQRFGGVRNSNCSHRRTNDDH